MKCNVCLWQAEWRYLLSGGMSVQELDNPAVSWLSDRAWLDVLGLSALDKFSNLAESFGEHLEGFKRYSDSNQPHRQAARNASVNKWMLVFFICVVQKLSICNNVWMCFMFMGREELPGTWDTELDPFQKLLILRCLRADCLVQGLQDFVAAQLGQRFIEPQVESLTFVLT